MLAPEVVQALERVPFLPELSQALKVDLEVTAALLLLFVLVSFLATYAAARVAFGRPRADSIVLVGPCGAGKTSLFLQLRDGSLHSGTVTSMVPNQGTFPLHSQLTKNPTARPVHVVDVPGHPRLRPLVHSFLLQARGVVFVVDALDFVPNIKTNAEFLYEVLTHPTVQRQRVPVLIAANKLDKVTANSVDFIRRQLEKEIQKLRSSRHSRLGVSEGQALTLGVKGEVFSFKHCVNPVTTAECSVLSGKFSDVEQFIWQQIKA